MSIPGSSLLWLDLPYHLSTTYKVLFYNANLNFHRKNQQYYTEWFLPGIVSRCHFNLQGPPCFFILYSHFQIMRIFFSFGAFKRCISVFSEKISSKFAGCQSLKREKSIQKYIFHYINLSKTFFIFALWILTTYHFKASWLNKNLFTSFESLETENVTKCLEMVISVSSEATGQS